MVTTFPTNPVWWGSMHAISSYHGNRPTNKQTQPQTHRQDRLQYTAPQLSSVQCSNTGCKMSVTYGENTRLTTALVKWVMIDKCYLGIKTGQRLIAQLDPRAMPVLDQYHTSTKFVSLKTGKLQFNKVAQPHTYMSWSWLWAVSPQVTKAINHCNYILPDLQWPPLPAEHHFLLASILLGNKRHMCVCVMWVQRRHSILKNGSAKCHYPVIYHLTRVTPERAVVETASPAS